MIFPSSTPRRAAVSPRALAVVVIVFILGGLMAFAWYILDQARSIKPTVTKSKPASNAPPKPSDLTPAERHYLDALAKRVQLPPAESWTDHRLVDLAARLNSELNARTPLALDPARTPWLLPFPITRASADLSGAQTIPLDLASGKIDLPAEAAFYQYSLTNTGTTPVPMPILFQGLRWDDAEALVTSAKLREIPDELDRTIAIWRLVASHRYHADPPTEGPEEHDLIKYLSCHGYGFCDDSAQAVAALAQLCQLQVRLTGLTGHVVPEIFAAGKWRMFDPDFAVYFHAPENPREILSLDDLTKSRTAFAHPIALGPGGPYDGAYAAPFLSTADNGDWPITATTTHRIDHDLAPGEKFVFTNYNWGRPFVGTSPQRVPRYYNGYIERPLLSANVTSSDGVTFRPEGDKLLVRNTSNVEGHLSFEVESPFPVVGGYLLFVSDLTPLAFEDLTPSASPRLNRLIPLPKEPRLAEKANPRCSLDFAIAQPTDTPTYRFRILLTVVRDSGYAISLPQIHLDFQFAEFPLLKLKPGPNTFQIFGETKNVKAELTWSPRGAK